MNLYSVWKKKKVWVSGNEVAIKEYVYDKKTGNVHFKTSGDILNSIPYSVKDITNKENEKYLMFEFDLPGFSDPPEIEHNTGTFRFSVEITSFLLNQNETISERRKKKEK